MKMSLDKEKISSLKSLANKMNDTSDKLDEAIESLNSTLADTNLGVAAWSMIALQDRSEIKEFTQPGDPEEGFEIGETQVITDEVHYAVELGYAEIDGKYQIGVRDATYAPMPGWPSDWMYLHKGRSESLLHASRAIRLEACVYFDELIECIARQAEKHIEDVGQLV
jgi:hypothetical protein